MSIDLGRVLMAAGVVSAAEVEAALFVSVVRGISLPRALVDRGAISERALEAELDRRGGMALRQVIASRELFSRLPRALCRRLAAIPTRQDPVTNTVDIAAADPLDPHIPAELGFHLGLPVRVLRAPISAVEEAIRGLELDERGPAEPRSRTRRVTPAFPHGAPQSTIPPPPLEDVPIPLVRRVAPLPSLEEEDEVVLPLRHVVERSTHRPSVPNPPRMAEGTGWTEPGRRPPPAARTALHEPPAPPPKVSFPSSPPEGALVPFVEAALRQPQAAAAAPTASAAPRPAPQAENPVPPTLRHGRLAMGRPEISVDIPPPRAEAEAVPDTLADAAPDTLAGAGADAVPDTVAEAAAEAEPPPAYSTLSEVLDALELARSRDEIVRITVDGLRLLARRVAVFAVKRGAFHGFACNRALGDEEALRQVVIPMDQPSILATATATTVYLGPIPGTMTHVPLLDVMENPSLDVAAVAVRVAGRPVMVLVADDLDDTLRGTRSMDKLSHAAGDALTRILAARL